MRGYHSKPCPNDPRDCDCRICWLWTHNDTANRAWRGPGVPTERQRSISQVRNPCFFLGEPVESPESCGCGKAVAHECQLFGRCRKVGQSLNGEPICSNCDRYALWGI